jgi:endonuclease-3
MNKEKRAEIFRRLQAIDPHPTTELEYGTPFELLVAVVLSAQATDKGVNLATRRLFPVANTPQMILALGEEGLRDYVKTIGLYQSKAKHIIQTCRILIDEHGGEVPATREALEKLPGVGRKTANVVLGHALGLPGFPVDRHVLRVASRIGLISPKAAEDAVKAEKKLTTLLPPGRWTRASDTLILHGRRICKPKPLCERCAVRAHCAYYRKR